MKYFSQSIWVDYIDRNGSSCKAYLFYTEVNTIKEWLDLRDYPFTELPKTIAGLLNQQSVQSEFYVKDKLISHMVSELKYHQYALLENQ
jgi:hypothetical protein